MFTRLRNSPAFALIALIFGVVCIGFSAIFVKIADVPGTISSFYRLFFAAIAIIPVWLYLGHKAPGSRDLLLIAVGSLFFAIDFLLWNSAILITTAAMATLLANNAPLWVGLIALTVFREKLPGRFWFGLLVSMIGLNILIGLQAWRTMEFNLGDIMSLAASFFYALYLVFTIDVRKRVDTVTFMTFSVVFMVVMVFLANLAAGHPFTGYSSRTWSALIAMGLISHFGGWLAINYALGHLKGANVSVTLLGQAVVTAIMGVIILGENLSLRHVLGGLLVLTGVYFVNRRTKAP